MVCRGGVEQRARRPLGIATGTARVPHLAPGTSHPSRVAPITPHHPAAPPHTHTHTHTGPFALKYVDKEGDVITMSSRTDVQQAIGELLSANRSALQQGPHGPKLTSLPPLRITVQPVASEVRVRGGGGRWGCWGQGVGGCAGRWPDVCGGSGVGMSVLRRCLQVSARSSLGGQLGGGA